MTKKLEKIEKGFGVCLEGVADGGRLSEVECLRQGQQKVENMIATSRYKIMRNNNNSIYPPLNTYKLPYHISGRPYM